MKSTYLSLLLLTLLFSCKKEAVKENTDSSTNRIAGKEKMFKTQHSGGNYYYTYSEISSAMSFMGASQISTPPGFTPEFQDHSNVYFYQLGSTVYCVYKWNNVEDIPEETESGCTRIWYSSDGSCNNNGNDCKPVLSGPTSVVIICC